MVEHHPEQLAWPGEDEVVQGGGQNGLVHGGRCHADNDSNGGLVGVVEIRHRRNQSVDVAAQTAGIRRVDRPDSAPPMGDRIGHHLGLRRSAPVYRRLADPGAGRDVVHAQLVVAAFGHTRQRRLEDDRVQRPIETPGTAPRARRSLPRVVARTLNCHGT